MGIFSKFILIIFIFTLLSFIPWIWPKVSYLGGHWNGNIQGEPVPSVILLILIILLLYSTISSAVYLIRGIGRKSWEAKTIVLLCFTALFIATILPVIFVITRYLPINSLATEVLSAAGLCLYPISAAIVLGKRNGLDQKMLFQQVASIEKLSNESLEREKEKKHLLENQNMELERRVIERTSEVQNQKALIELKNRAITDNLNYARRIQSAILPDIKLIYKTLAKSFIIYAPKDIVSGDFYVFAEKNDQVIIIAGDGTGHGVSGAFMSMIGSSILNQIIVEKGITQPALILNSLNTSIIDTLKQNENETNDGMDIAICTIDLKTFRLSFAGANRPLWVIRQNELIVTRPDKFPIGGLQVARERVFTDNNIQLTTGDTFYLFTDGFANQFGGKDGKKMMTSKFKSLLLSIQHLEMTAQEQYLKNYFEDWKGNNDQVDDVLVIGVRV